MIEDLSVLSDDLTIDGELVVIGAGPAGIVTALEAARRGLKVVVIESGQQSYDLSAQQLSAAASEGNRHAPMTMAVRRQIGGTSTIWGGRCVPYDPIDFERRSFAGLVSWPVGYEEMEEYFQRACDWLVCGRAMFNASGIPNAPSGIVPGLKDGDVTTSTLERWSLPTDFGKTYLAELKRSRNVRLITGLTATEVVCPPERREAEYLKARTLGGAEVRVKAKAFVIACGGLESTRLLMSSVGPHGGSMGGESGHLGRWYMAHAEGVVAHVRFSTPPASTIYGYERDIDGVYVRRRFGFTKEFQLAHELPNIAGWIANPEIPDASHKSGPLSFVYLTLSSPLGPRFAPDAQRLSLTGVDIPGTPYGGSAITSKVSHLRNMLHEPVVTAQFMAEFGAKRFLARQRRVPGFFVYNKDNVYPIQYHGEHLPNAASRVELTRQTDEIGRPKLNIDLRFSDADVDGVVRAHEYWDAYFRALGVGQLEYPESDLRGAIRSRLGGGFHQIGTTRMSAKPSDGVVDANLAIHGMSNVYVASSSTFVTSGQANSTFMIVAFALRLADYLHQVMR
jgi:choline dehydrogenase-like flavoprotein